MDETQRLLQMLLEISQKTHAAIESLSARVDSMQVQINEMKVQIDRLESEVASIRSTMATKEDIAMVLECCATKEDVHIVQQNVDRLEKQFLLKEARQDQEILILKQKLSL